METRMFAWQEGVTKPLRTKEKDKDYRYMPEADLPPLRLSQVWAYVFVVWRWLRGRTGPLLTTF